MSELQRIVDSLARTTRRAVSVHDRSRNLLAFSSHDGVIDEVRKESILTRKGPARGFEWAKSFGIETADGPLRIPANHDIDMEARVCAPVRFGGRLLGFLWLVDPDETLEPELFDMVRTAAGLCRARDQPPGARGRDRPWTRTRAPCATCSRTSRTSATTPPPI